MRCREQKNGNNVSSRDLPPATAGYAASFLRNQVCAAIPPLPLDIDLSGRVAVVTGSNSGLGRESARHLLQHGLSHLIMAVRSLERGQAAARDLQSANTKAKIDVWLLDMNSYQSVQSFARQCESLDHIDITILNAGLASVDFHVEPSTGHEQVMQVNYWSTVLLASLLVPILKAKASTSYTPHLSVINSGMSQFSTLPNKAQKPFLKSFDDTEITPWDPQARYNDSKLLGQFFLTRMADKISSDEVIINMVEPGLTKGTELFKSIGGWQGAVFNALKSAAARPAEVASITYVDAAVVKGAESHGSFIAICKIEPLAPLTYGEEGKQLGDCIWEETLEEWRKLDSAETLRYLL